MERREFIALFGLAAAMMPQPAAAGPARPSGGHGARLIGSWGFASSINIRRDGSTFDRWGPDPKGILMFDNGGHYAQIILGTESRVFGAKVFCSFGSYSVDDAKNLLVTRVTACSVPRLNGNTQTRHILRLTADELKYSNPLASRGSTAEVLWKRVET
jgi:hypothetical protein